MYQHQHLDRLKNTEAELVAAAREPLAKQRLKKDKAVSSSIPKPPQHRGKREKVRIKRKSVKLRDKKAILKDLRVVFDEQCRCMQHARCGAKLMHWCAASGSQRSDPP